MLRNYHTNTDSIMNSVAQAFGLNKISAMFYILTMIVFFSFNAIQAMITKKLDNY